MKKYSYLLIILLFLSNSLTAQVYHNPIAAKQSHPELEIQRIEITGTETIISLKVTNKLNQGGWFCADSNIYIKNSKGTEKYELIKSENIPICPDQFEFSYSGQTLEFNLHFPNISKEIKFIDLIEDCSNACFSFQRIILDNNHNANIRAFEKAFDLYQNIKKKEAIPYFEEVISNKSSIDSHIYGLSYYYLVVIYHELENFDKVDIWYNKLMDSNLDDKATFIKELEKSGIKK